MTSLCNCCQVQSNEEQLIIDTPISKGQKLLTDFFPIKTKKTGTPKLLCNLIVKIIRDFHNQYDEYLTKNLQQNTNTIDVYNYFKSFDVYTSLLIDLKMLSNTEPCENVGESVQPPLAMKLKKDFSDNNGKHVTVSKEEKEKDALYAMNFHDKVRETFMAENCPKDYDAFQSLLLDFNSKTDSVPELYHVSCKLNIYYFLVHTFMI